MKRATLILGLLLAAPLSAWAQCPVPGSGYPDPSGTPITGGQGQSIVQVTNLNDSGAGSLRAAVEGSNRCIQFTVGGSINLTSGPINIRGRSNVTIDGLTAPSPGITLLRHGVWARESSVNVLTRGVRVRCFTPGTLSTCPSHGFNSFAGAGHTNSRIAFVNVSVNGHWDGGTESGSGSDVVVLDSIIGRGTPNPADPAHEFGHLSAAFGGRTTRAIFSRNLVVDSRSRNPQCGSTSHNGLAQCKIVNNLIWNFQDRGALVRGNIGTGVFAEVVGNYFFDGPWPGSGAPTAARAIQRDGGGQCYGEGNYAHSGNPTVTGTQIDAQCNLGAPPLTGFSSVPTVSAVESACAILANAGARGPNFGLDAVDLAYLATINIDGGCAPPEPPPGTPTIVEILEDDIYKSPSAETNVSIPYTTPSGTNLANLIAVFHGTSNSTPITGDLDYDGVACSEIGQSIGPGIARQVTLHLCLDPDPGAADFEFELNASREIGAFIATLQYVDQTTGFRAVSTSNSTTNVGSVSTSVTSQEGDWVAVFTVAGAGTDPVNGAGQTPLAEDEDFATVRSFAAGWKSGLPDSTPLLVNFSGSTGTHATLAVSIISDGSTPPPGPGEITLLGTQVYSSPSTSTVHTPSWTVPSGTDRLIFLVGSPSNGNIWNGTTEFPQNTTNCTFQVQSSAQSGNARRTGIVECPVTIGTNTMEMTLNGDRHLTVQALYLQGVSADAGPFSNGLRGLFHDANAMTAAGGSVTATTEVGDKVFGVYISSTAAGPINSSAGGQQALLDKQLVGASGTGGQSIATGWKPGGESNTTLNFVNDDLNATWVASSIVLIPDTAPPVLPLITDHGGCSFSSPAETGLIEFIVEGCEVPADLDGGYIACMWALTRGVGTVDLMDLTLTRNGTEVFTHVVQGGAAGAGAVSGYFAHFLDPAPGTFDIVVDSPSQPQNITIHCRVLSGVRIAGTLGPIVDAVNGGSFEEGIATQASVGVNSSFNDLVISLVAVGGSPDALIPNAGQGEWLEDSPIGPDATRRTAASFRYADPDTTSTQVGYAWGTEDIFSILGVTIRGDDGSPDPEPPVITGISPDTEDRGETAAVTITGTGFTEDAGLFVDALGFIQIENQVVVDATEITADFVIAPNTPPGAYPVIVFTDAGVSNDDQLFTVTAPVKYFNPFGGSRVIQ